MSTSKSVNTYGNDFGNWYGYFSLHGITPTRHSKRQELNTLQQDQKQQLGSEDTSPVPHEPQFSEYSPPPPNEWHMTYTKLLGQIEERFTFVGLFELLAVPRFGAKSYSRSSSDRAQALRLQTLTTRDTQKQQHSKSLWIITTTGLQFNHTTVHLKEMYQQKVHSVLMETLRVEQHFQFFQMDIKTF